MRPDKYILDGKTPVATDDLHLWGKSYQIENRRVNQTEIDGVRISTVFLGLDHQYDDGPPLLFETMIFEGEHDGYQDRCSTWEQAEVMHQKAVDIVNGKMEPE